MRFKSKKVDGYQVFAVSGTNTVSFGIDFDSTKTKGLLGFGVTRKDPGKEKPYDMYGFKVFPSIVPKPDEKTSVRTSQHPIQSFVWDDFTAAGRDLRIRFPSIEGHTQEPRSPCESQFRSRSGRKSCFQTWSTTFFSIGASPVAKPMSGSSETRSPISSPRQSARKLRNG